MLEVFLTEFSEFLPSEVLIFSKIDISTERQKVLKIVCKFSYLIFYGYFW